MQLYLFFFLFLSFVLFYNIHFKVYHYEHASIGYVQNTDQNPGCRFRHSEILSMKNEMSRFGPLSHFALGHPITGSFGTIQKDSCTD